MRKALLFFWLGCSFALGQTGGPLVVNGSGVIVQPVNAVTFKAANSIGGGGSGTVTSITVTPGTGLTGGGTITTSGTLNIGLGTMLTAVNSGTFTGQSSGTFTGLSTGTFSGTAIFSSLTSNGLVTTSGGNGTLSVTVPGSGVLTALAGNINEAGGLAWATADGSIPWLGTVDSGHHSVAIGYASSAIVSGTAIGDTVTAGNFGTAVGDFASAGAESVSIGTSSVAANVGIAVGSSTTTSGNGVAIGASASATTGFAGGAVAVETGGGVELLSGTYAGTGLAIAGTEIFNGTTIDAAVLPIASASTLGAIIVGSGLSISGSGVLSATGGGTLTEIYPGTGITTNPALGITTTGTVTVTNPVPANLTLANTGTFTLTAASTGTITTEGNATNGSYSISATGTTTLSATGPVNSAALTFGAGSGAYTASIVLSDAGVFNGQLYELKVGMPASANPTVKIYDGSTSGALISSPATYAVTGTTTLSFFNQTGTWTAYNKGAALDQANLADLQSASTALTNLGFTGSGVQAAISNAVNAANGFLTYAFTGSTNITTVGTLSAGSIPYSLLTGTPATGVSSVTANANSTLTISPTTGAVIAGINLANTNTWTGAQTLVAPLLDDANGYKVLGTGTNTGTLTNYFQVQGASTGNSPIFSTQGSDSNINLTLTPKGSGVVVVNGLAGGWATSAFGSAAFGQESAAIGNTGVVCINSLPLGWTSGTGVGIGQALETGYYRVSPGIIRAAGTVVANAAQLQAGTIATQFLPTPTGTTTIALTGSGGSTPYAYNAYAIQADGMNTGTIVQATTSSGPSALSSSVYYTITVPAIPAGAVGWGVIRTAGGTNQGFIGTITSGTTLQDKNLSAPVASPYTNIPSTTATAAANRTGSVFIPNHILFTGTTTPTIAAGTGAGTSPTVSYTGNDNCGSISVTTGTLPTASATVCTITFANAWPNASYSTLTPTNANALSATGATGVYVTNSTTTIVLTSGATGLTAATTYTFNCNTSGY